MSAFVFVCEDEATKHEGVELPTEEDGSLLLSVLQSQYEGGFGTQVQVTEDHCVAPQIEECIDYALYYLWRHVNKKPSKFSAARGLF